MKLNSKVLPILSTLLLTGAFMQAAIGAQGSTVIGFEVLSEKTGSTTPTGGVPHEVPVTATWQGDDRIVITAAGYQDCPVLPASMTTSAGVALIDLAVAAHDRSCGSSLASFTTVIRIQGWDKERPSRFVVREVDGTSTDVVVP